MDSRNRRRRGAIIFKQEEPIIPIVEQTENTIIEDKEVINETITEIIENVETNEPIIVMDLNVKEEMLTINEISNIVTNNTNEHIDNLTINIIDHPIIINNNTHVEEEVISFNNEIEKKYDDLEWVTAKNFDINQYLGIWYEILRLPSPFELNLYNTMAMYLKYEDKFNVINSGYDNGNYVKQSGVMKTTDEPFVLKVSFGEYGWIDYIIKYVDVKYDYAIVTNKSNTLLWVLSKFKKPSSEIMDVLKCKVKELGFDINDFTNPQI